MINFDNFSLSIKGIIPQPRMFGYYIKNYFALYLKEVYINPLCVIIPYILLSGVVNYNTRTLTTLK